MATATFSDSTRLLIGRDTTRCAAARTTGDSPPPSFPTAMARRAGAFIVREPHDTFWGGYAGYFQDPDQHLWEVVWNPNLLPE